MVQRLQRTNYAVYDVPAPASVAVFDTVVAKNFDVLDNANTARRFVTTFVDGGGTHISYSSGATASNKMNGPGTEFLHDIDVDGTGYFEGNIDVTGTSLFRARADFNGTEAARVTGVLDVRGLIRDKTAQTGTPGQALQVIGAGNGVVWV